MNNDFKGVFKELIPNDDRPIVVFSAMWPLVYALKKNASEITDSVLDALMESKNEQQSLFMPSFTNGFQDGVCNLDTEASSTGVLSEKFKKMNGSKRTISAFFSFVVNGKDSLETTNLRAEEAWGVGSLYEWFHLQDAHIVTIGVHPTHCSFTHRAEWLARDIIKYRYEKSFKGKIICANQELLIQEKLYVRLLKPEVITDWTWLLDLYKENGMNIIKHNNMVFSEMSAKRKMDLIVPILKENPLALVKNKDDLRYLYNV